MATGPGEPGAARVAGVEQRPPVTVSRTGRIVFHGQWWVALATPFLLLVSRPSLGAPAGWLSTTGVLLLAPPLFLVLAAPVMVVALDTVARSTRSVRPPYARASLVLWAALAVLVVTVADPAVADSSLASSWTQGAVPPAVTTPIAWVAALVAIAAWASALAFAVAGYLETRRVADVD